MCSSEGETVKTALNDPNQPPAFRGEEQGHEIKSGSMDIDRRGSRLLEHRNRSRAGRRRPGGIGRCYEGRHGDPTEKLD
jgi:hypothetical protein